MRTTIDSAGRVVIPKAMRARLGIEGHSELDIEEHDGVVEIRPPDRAIRVVEGEDGRPVLRAPEGAPRLTDEDVRRMIEDSRSWPRSS